MELATSGLNTDNGGDCHAVAEQLGHEFGGDGLCLAKIK